MAKYSIEFSATAERQLAKLSKADQLRILRVIRDLSTEPYPRGTRTNYKDTPLCTEFGSESTAFSMASNPSV